MYYITYKYSPREQIGPEGQSLIGLSGIILRPARVEEASTLTELCLRSKAVWGYDAEFLEACRAELVLHPADFESSYVEAAEIGRELVGMCQLTLTNGRGILERLFVDPSCLGRGIGRLLYRWAEDLARSNGAAEISIEADPGAESFYRRMGAIDDGTVASGSIPGRRIPWLRVILHQNRDGREREPEAINSLRAPRFDSSSNSSVCGRAFIQRS